MAGRRETTGFGHPSQGADRLAVDRGARRQPAEGQVGEAIRRPGEQQRRPGPHRIRRQAVESPGRGEHQVCRPLPERRPPEQPARDPVPGAGPQGAGCRRGEVPGGDARDQGRQMPPGTGETRVQVVQAGEGAQEGRHPGRLAGKQVCSPPLPEAQARRRPPEQQAQGCPPHHRGHQVLKHRRRHDCRAHRLHAPSGGAEREQVPEGEGRGEDGRGRNLVAQHRHHQPTGGDCGRDQGPKVKTFKHEGRAPGPGGLPRRRWRRPATRRPRHAGRCPQ